MSAAPARATIATPIAFVRRSMDLRPLGSQRSCLAGDSPPRGGEHPSRTRILIVTPPASPLRRRRTRIAGSSTRSQMDFRREGKEDDIALEPGKTAGEPRRWTTPPVPIRASVLAAVSLLAMILVLGVLVTQVDLLRLIYPLLAGREHGFSAGSFRGHRRGHRVVGRGARRVPFHQRPRVSPLGHPVLGIIGDSVTCRDRRRGSPHLAATPRRRPRCARCENGSSTVASALRQAEHYRMTSSS